MLFSIHPCKSQAPAASAVAAAAAAISGLRFASYSSSSSSSSSTALIPLQRPEESPFASLLASDPPPPEPLREVLATGDVHAALRGLPGLARQLFRWAEATPRGFPRCASAYAAVLVPLAEAKHLQAAHPVSVRAIHLSLLLPLVSLLSFFTTVSLHYLLNLLLRLSTNFSTEYRARNPAPSTCSTLCLAAFREMAPHGVPPFIKECNLVLRALRDEARWDGMRSVHADMLQLGIEPSIVTYNTLLDSFFKEGRVDQAAKLLREMEAVRMKFVEMRAMGLLPDLITYNSLINGYCKAGHLQEALWLLGDLNRSGLAPSVLTYNILFRWLL